MGRTGLKCGLRALTPLGLPLNSKFVSRDTLPLEHGNPREKEEADISQGGEMGFALRLPKVLAKFCPLPSAS